MKKAVVGLIVIILFCLEVYKVYNYGSSPYLGKYRSPKSNTTLVLKRGDKCTLVGNQLKESTYSYGSYNIKDNKITIYLNKNYCGSSYLKGKFQGASISFFNKLEKEDNIYYKE
ncbi:hypothetical protein ACJDT4_06590 [Clostridium neuense]|uniref:DUF3139 domain-containing protein n=1 Tax=Clostridium neuense TaxID=1728934 RepID=A0ABW8TC74_9CLOT